MNKKQEALRRGLRSFIEDTSKELADLEGRPLGPFPDPQSTDDEAIVASDAAAAGRPERTAPDRVTAEVARAESPRHEATAKVDRAESPRHDAQVGAVPVPESPTETARIMAGPGALSISRPPEASHAPAASAPRTKEPLTERRQAPPVAQRDAPPVAEPGAPSVAERETRPVAERDASPAVRHRVPPATPPNATPADRQEGETGARPVAAPEPPLRRYSEAPAAPSHAEKAKRRAQVPVRRRSRPRRAAEIGANGVSPAQVHARKGVCFAYFLNHECWRVADAYCNSALQVCITRECPIYHLHKDALEHRFARKFKHFW